MQKEIIGRFLMIIGTVASGWLSWWAPLVAAPLIFKIFILKFCFTDRIYDRNQRLIMDLITHASYVGYLILSVVLFSQNTGRWYLGLILWFFVAQLFGFFWPRRWHFEALEERV